MPSRKLGNEQRGRVGAVLPEGLWRLWLKAAADGRHRAVSGLGAASDVADGRCNQSECDTFLSLRRQGGLMRVPRTWFAVSASVFGAVFVLVACPGNDETDKDITDVVESDVAVPEDDGHAPADVADTEAPVLDGTADGGPFDTGPGDGGADVVEDTWVPPAIVMGPTTHRVVLRPDPSPSEQKALEEYFLQAIQDPAGAVSNKARYREVIILITDKIARWEKLTERDDSDT